MNPTKVSSTTVNTVPLKQTKTGTIELRVKTRDLGVNHAADGVSFVLIDVPVKDVERLFSNLYDDLDLHGIARSAADKAVQAFRDTLQEELVIDALRQFVVKGNDIKI